MRFFLHLSLLPAGWIAAALFLGGCASYPNRIYQAEVRFANSDFDGALAAIEPGDCEGGRDQLVFLFERATIKHTKGDFAGSNEDFEQAYRVIADYEERAKLSLRDGLAETQAFLVNDTALPYKGEGFEKMLLHVYKALNYLMLGDITGARVEIKRLDERQTLEKEAHEREINLAEEKAKEQNLPPDQVSDAEQRLRDAYGPSLQLAQKVKSLYLSAIGSYLSSLIYDITGEYDEALIDCRRVISEAPDFTAAVIDACSLGADDITPPPVQLDLRQRGDLVILYQCGLAPVKQEVGIPIPTGHGWLAVAFPIYRVVPTALDRAQVLIDGAPAGISAVVTDVEAQAVRTLVDQIPALVIRQIIRIVLKAVALQAAHGQGDAAELLVSLYNVFSEQADLRSWLTLPRNIQAVRIYPPLGKHTVKIALTDPGGQALGEVTKEMEFRNDQIVLANLRGIGYTPLVPQSLNVTAHWQTLPRVPLPGRPRAIFQ